jgi:hypothetical protein
MHEPFDTRAWADHGHELSASLHQAFTKVGEAFRKLSDIEFNAPWRTRSSTRL